MEELVQAEPQKDNVQEQKTEEYVKLLEDYNQNVETYKELNEECSKVSSERDSLIQTIKLMEEQALQSPSLIQETEEEKPSVQEENTAAHNELLEAYNKLNEECKKLMDEKETLNETIKSMKEELVKPEPEKDNVQTQKAEEYEILQLFILNS